jgi:hypothetical protein
VGRARLVDVERAPSVVAVAYEGPDGAMLAMHNLGGKAKTVDVGPQPEQGDRAPVDVYGDGPTIDVDRKLRGIRLRPYGYRWIRLR